VLDILEDPPVGSTVHAEQVNIETGRYPANFMLSLAAKDTRPGRPAQR